jgi:CRISPR-associated protein Csd1
VTILQELVALYDARAEDKKWPKRGFSTVGIGAAVELDEDGSVRNIFRLGAPKERGKGFAPRQLIVPSPPADRRGKKVVPGRFWDPMPYALGVGGKPGAWSPDAGNAATKFEKFRTEHIAILQDIDAPALVALRLFCETWKPERFAEFPDAEALVGENVVFRGPGGVFVHELPEARKLLVASNGRDALCLATGKRAPVARLHIPIKVPFHDKQPPLVSFNATAFESHGKKQGDNAPVSEAAAFAYGTALNALLAEGSGNNLRIGGDTVAFWAEDGGAEDAFRAMFAGSDAEAEVELRGRLLAVAEGRARDDNALEPDARLFVLGLAPNAARLSVRYWYPGTLGDFARAVRRFWQDMAIVPSPFVKDGMELSPKPWALLYDLAAQQDAAKIPFGLGGDLIRAILRGGLYPSTLLTSTIGRIRVEGEPDRARYGNVDGRRAAMIAAVLRRNYEREVPMALDEDDRGAAYLLGRLFAAYAYAEKSNQERNAGLREKYLGAASATPARVFPVLMRSYEHNLSSLRKAGGQKAGAGVKADRAVAAIMDGLGGDLPGTLPLEEQGKFFIGFYHQLSAFYAKAEDVDDGLIEDEDETGGEEA